MLLSFLTGRGFQSHSKERKMVGLELSLEQAEKATGQLLPQQCKREQRFCILLAGEDVYL